MLFELSSYDLPRWAAAAALTVGAALEFLLAILR